MMWSPSEASALRRLGAVALLAVAAWSCRPPTTKDTDSPYKVAADRFGEAYCALAFSDGCSVPEACGLPAGFEALSDCRYRLVPFLRACPVPDADADAVIAVLDECSDVLDVATCADPLCDGGTLDTDPCLAAFEALASFCPYDGL